MISHQIYDELKKYIINNNLHYVLHLYLFQKITIYTHNQINTDEYMAMALL